MKPSLKVLVLPLFALLLFAIAHQFNPLLSHPVPYDYPYARIIPWSCDRECRMERLLSSHGRYDIGGLNKQGKHFFSIVAVIKDADEMVHEFIIRNYLAGVDKFYIVDDGAEGRLKNLLEVFGELVEVVEVGTEKEFLEGIGRPGEKWIQGVKNRQTRVYWELFKRYGSGSTWMMPIDVDEFLESKGRRRDGFMTGVLKRAQTKNFPMVSGRWNSVMSNGRILPPKAGSGTLSMMFPRVCGMRESFSRKDVIWEVNSAKSAVMPALVDMEAHARAGRFFNHGLTHFNLGKADYLELFFKSDPSSRSANFFEHFRPKLDTSESEFYLTHYWSRSLSEYVSKRSRGQIDGRPMRTLGEFIWREKCCRELGYKGVSQSAKEREGRVWKLLRLIDGYQNIQEVYRESVVVHYEQIHLTKNVSQIEKEFRQLLAENGEELV